MKAGGHSHWRRKFQRLNSIGAVFWNNCSPLDISELPGLERAKVRGLQPSFTPNWERRQIKPFAPPGYSTKANCPRFYLKGSVGNCVFL
jgi:hypothetical protein